MSEPLRGLRIQIEFENDENNTNYPALPPGTILRTLSGTDGESYYLVKLDRAVKDQNKNRIMSELVISPYFKGTSLRSLVSAPKEKFVPIAIASVLYQLENDDPILDFSKVEYFAIGSAHPA